MQSPEQQPISVVTAEKMIVPLGQRLCHDPQTGGCPPPDPRGYLRTKEANKRNILPHIKRQDALFRYGHRRPRLYRFTSVDRKY